MNAGASRAADITSRARKGAAWSLIIAGIAFPLTLLRSIILGRISREVLGEFQLLLIFLNGIYTFLFPGGRNVLPAYLPKLRDAEDRNAFASGFLYMVLGAAAIGLVAAGMFPEIIDATMQRTLDDRTRNVLRCLIPLALLAALGSSAITANMSFVWASVLQSVQVVCVTVMATMLYIRSADMTVEDTTFWLAATLTFAAGLTTIISCVVLSRDLRIRLRTKFPDGCLRFAGVTYLDTVMMWAYLSIDNYFVLLWFGTSQLGVYAAAMVIARIIPLAVQQLGHLLLTTFSKLLGSDEEEGMVTAYRRVCRLTVGFYAMMSVGIIFFARPLLLLYGPEYAEHHRYLIALAVVMNVDSLRTINGMTLMAYEHMSSVFASKVLQSGVEFCVSLALIDSCGVYGVIVGKGCGHIVSSAVLFITTARIKARTKLLPPNVFIWSQLIVAVAAVAAWRAGGTSLGVSIPGALVGWAAVVLAGRFGMDDLRALMPWRRATGGRA